MVVQMRIRASRHDRRSPPPAGPGLWPARSQAAAEPGIREPRDVRPPGFADSRTSAPANDGVADELFTAISTYYAALHAAMRGAGACRMIVHPRDAWRWP